ncbi:MAG: DUF3592 domain-containing protein, partial [Gemmataceae bacterium]|nr:DUF3592 domain-containing protein [Gemmataceae bacterium]
MRLLLTLFFLVWAGVVVVADAAVAYGVRTAVRSADWTPTDGVVTRSELKFGRKNSVSLDLAYSYAVDGRRLTGREYQPGPHLLPSDKWRAVHAALPVGSRVTVHYNPADPAEAVLVPGLKPDVLLVLLGLMPFNVIAVGLGWAWWAAVTRRRQFDPARDVRPTADGYAARLNGFGPVAVFAAALLALSFVGVLVVIFLVHDVGKVPVSWAVDGGIWAVILAACGLLAWTHRHPRAVVEWLDTLTVPTTATGRATTTVPRAAVREIDVRTATRRTKKSVRHVFVPTLVLDPTHPGPTEIPFAEYPEQADAD